MLIEKEWW